MMTTSIELSELSQAWYVTSVFSVAFSRTRHNTLLGERTHVAIRMHRPYAAV